MIQNAEYINKESKTSSLFNTPRGFKPVVFKNAEQINNNVKTKPLKTGPGLKAINNSFSTIFNNIFTKVSLPGLNTAYSSDINEPGLDSTLLNDFSFNTQPAGKLLPVPPGFESKHLALKNDKMNDLKETSLVNICEEKSTKKNVLPPPGFDNVQPSVSKCDKFVSLDASPGFKSSDLLQSIPQVANFQNSSCKEIKTR